MTLKSSFLLATLLIFASCDEDLKTTPKPKTYLRADLPEAEYVDYRSNCDYNFKLNKLYKVNDVVENGKTLCHKDIDLGPLNAVIHFSYIEMDTSLAAYVNYANDKIEDHNVKASGIEDKRILRSKDRVFGVLFKLKGDVATPYQFYLTDSSHYFVNGAVFFNSRPNYDSLRPSLDYLEKDLNVLLESFQWK